jgi:hypothetical protein
MKRLSLLGIVGLCGASALGADFTGLSRLTPGRVKAENGLWIEVPLERQFKSGRTVTVAEIQGTGVITMIHFALPQLSIIDPKYQLNRDLLIQMFWDGEAEPSVNVPFVDFFCDPMGRRDVVNTTLVNKKRGWNAYFPMPYRKSAKIVLAYEGGEAPGEKLWAMMPCYSYVIYREMAGMSPAEGYLHAQWRQAAVNTGKVDYTAMEARGRGKFVGWNVTVRQPGAPGYPVDMNEKFYVDGEAEASVEFQGIEDSFGFSWGFPPESENSFAMTGYWPFLKAGAMAYRWFVNDAIAFEKSLKLDVGYGRNEHPTFREQFSRPGMELQFSSTCYWYQVEPHAPFPPMLKPADREPAPENRFWLHPEVLPGVEQLKARGVRFHMLCGRPDRQVLYAEPGFAAECRQGHAYDGWAPPVYHCLSDDQELRIELTVPRREAGRLRLFILDPDSFKGGRKQRLTVGGRELGEFSGFQQGKWVETDITPDMSAQGTLPIVAKNVNGNAVISVIEWVKSR